MDPPFSDPYKQGYELARYEKKMFAQQYNQYVSMGKGIVV
jgi:hypothetical protein